MKRVFLLAVLIAAFSLTFVFADYGAFVQGEFDTVGKDDTGISGSIVFAPWLSLPFGKSELSVSAGLHTHISDNTYAAPDLLQLEFSSSISPLFSFRLGRFNWQDSSGFVAGGRFDGAELFFSPGNIRIGINALYTGLLFKDTADISISPTGTNIYDTPFDWKDFTGTYAAPRRLMASVHGEFPGFPQGRGQLYAGILAQFDFTDASEKLNTQYLLLRHVMVIKAFDLDLAVATELENTETKNVRPAFAYSLEAGLQPPASFNNRISLGMSWASGKGDYTAAFFPVTLKAQSFVLEPGFSGMMIIRMNYQARILPSLSANLGAFYFIRTDSSSFTAAHLEPNSYPLGMELAAGAKWIPLSDLSFSLNGGVFLPQTGTAWAADAPVLWRITLGAIFSF